MIRYRDFRTVDLPALAALWGASFADIAGLMPFSAPLLDEWILARPWFRPDLLRIAETDGETPRIVGAILAGPGCDPNEIRVDPSVGIVALLGVDPDYRRLGIGRELLTHIRGHLTAAGASKILFGCSPLARPFGLGLWKAVGPFGVVESPDDDSAKLPFLARMGFVPDSGWLSLSRSLALPIRMVDYRYAGLHRRTELISEPFAPVTAWLSGVYGLLDPLQHTLVDRRTRQVLARCTVLQLNPDREEGVIERLWVDPEHRRQGIGGLLVNLIVRRWQDEQLELVRAIVSEGDPATEALRVRAGFEIEGRGRVWRYEG